MITFIYFKWIIGNSFSRTDLTPFCIKSTATDVLHMFFLLRNTHPQKILSLKRLEANIVKAKTKIFDTWDKIMD